MVKLKPLLIGNSFFWKKIKELAIPSLTETNMKLSNTQLKSRYATMIELIFRSTEQRFKKAKANKYDYDNDIRIGSKVECMSTISSGGVIIYMYLSAATDEAGKTTIKTVPVVDGKKLQSNIKKYVLADATYAMAQAKFIRDVAKGIADDFRALVK